MPPLPAWRNPLGLGLGLTLVGVIWWHYGTAFHDQAIPFYDSLGYQEGYRQVARLSAASHPGAALGRAWAEPGNNVILYKFFAAVAGPVLPSPREGLFVYLFGLHLSAAIALFVTVRRLAGASAPAWFALATWLSTVPFGLLRDGIGDQRMDLASGSCYLFTAALGLIWLHRPTATTALLTGLGAALAALHRPVMAPAIALLAVLLLGLALTSHRQHGRAWTAQIAAGLGPLLVLVVPWFLRHFDGLRHYYLEYNYDVGNVDTLAGSLAFNLAAFWRSWGWTPTVGLLAGGLLLLAGGARLHLRRAALIVVIWWIPLAIVVASKSAANLFVQQIALGLPPLLFAAFVLPATAVRTNRLAFVALAAVVGFQPMRLGRSLAHERPRARAEVEAVVRAIADVAPAATLASFHDLPANTPALVAVARDLGLDLTVGLTAYHPTDFQLANDLRDDVTSPAVRERVVATLADIKTRRQWVILPTEATSFRLWQGLYSHRLVPLLRTEIDRDPSFHRRTTVGPIHEVMFDLYEVR